MDTIVGPEKRSSSFQIGARPITSLLFLPLAFTYRLSEFSNALLHPLGLYLEILEIFLKLCYDLLSGQEVPGWIAWSTAALPAMMTCSPRGVVGGMSTAVFTGMAHFTLSLLDNGFCMLLALRPAPLLLVVLRQGPGSVLELQGL